MTCSRCQVLEKKLDVLETEMKTSEENRIKQLEKLQDEIKGYKSEIAKLQEANEHQKKRVEVLIMEKNKPEQSNHLNKTSKNNYYSNKLMEENNGLKSEIASKNKELFEMKIKLDNLAKEKAHCSNEIKRLSSEVEELKSNCQKFKEGAISRNKGRKYLLLDR